MRADEPRGLREAERGFLRRDSAAAGPGQFVMVRHGEDGERIPLAVADYDRRKGTIILVIQAVGKTTCMLMELQQGEFADEVFGPLGNARHCGPHNRVICVGGDGREVLAIGSLVMMKACADLTRPRSIPTVVSVKPILVDGIGLRGGCRVTVGGRKKYACLDGPEFDGHEVDFEELALRMKRFEREERESLRLYQECHHTSRSV